MGNFDFSSLSPVERIALADTLYDSAMQEIDAMTPKLSSDQMAEVDRRIAEVKTGHVELIDWGQFHAELTKGR
jgi:putative addiction module component (TIGR02574 family)